MRILTSEQAYFLDKTSTDTYGINSIDLMGNAGQRIALNIEEILTKVSKPKIFIICGKGNNGEVLSNPTKIISMRTKN